MEININDEKFMNIVGEVFEEMEVDDYRRNMRRIGRRWIII